MKSILKKVLYLKGKDANIECTQHTQVKHHPARDMDQEKGSLWKMNACLTHFQNRAMQVNLTVFLEGKRPVS